MGYKSLSDIEDMTLYEYDMKMRAYNLARVDYEHDLHLSAWLYNLAGSTKEQGKKQVPVFKKFEDFFNYKKRLREVEQPKRKAISPEMRKMARIAARVNAGRRE